MYSIKVFVNGEPEYHFQTDEFSFSESRYINAHMDYSLKALTKRRTHDLFREPGEYLSMNKLFRNDGIIDSAPGESDSISVVVKDAYGNTSELHFILKRNLNSLIKGNSGQDVTEKTRPFEWYHSNYFSNHHVQMTIPEGALYENTQFSYNRRNSGQIFYPFIHHIHSEEVPLQKYANLAIRTDSVSAHLLPWTGIVWLPKKGDPEWKGGQTHDGWISADVREFGDFTLEADTLPPVITPINVSRGRNMKNQKSLRLRIKDGLSGIDSYEGFIDNTWVLFEYDPKNDLLYYIFDPDRLNTGSSHELEVYVKDKAGNPAVFHTTFYW